MIPAFFYLETRKCENAKESAVKGKLIGHRPIVFGLCLHVCGIGSAADVTIQWEPPNDPAARFVVKGVSAEALETLSTKANAQSNEASKLFNVYTTANGKRAETAMSGDVEIRKDMIVFTPRYPLRAGMTFRAVFDPSQIKDRGLAGLSKQEKDFALPSLSPGEATRLTEIFPSGEVLPENLLRLYLYFSAPMSRGEAYQRIHLLNEKGKTVEFPFLELGEELWSPDGRRFSLYFDPGRIKRGLKPRELFGPALIEGGTYSLVIDAAWIDANGQPLKQSFTKKFRVGPPDDKQPNPHKWKIHAPRIDSLEPLVVDLDEPLDSGMLQRVLEIRNPAGQVVPGEIRLANHEQRWEFVPGENWKAGPHRLIVSTGLEDLAGNSIRRLFEIDILRPAVPGSDSEVVELPFKVEESKP
jgi:hypothetical protein